MIPQIEDAVSSFLAARLATPLAAVAHSVRPATSLEALPEDRIVIIARGADMPRLTVNDDLYDAQLEILVMTPLVNGVTKANHALAMKSVGEAFVAANETELNAAVVAALPGFHCGGFFASGWQPGREDTQWLPHFNVKIGVAKDGL